MRMKVYRIIIHRGAFSPYYSNLKQFFFQTTTIKDLYSKYLHTLRYFKILLAYLPRFSTF